MRLIILTALATTMMFAQTESRMQSLRSVLESTMNSHTGRFAVAFSDLTTGEQLLINAKEQFHAASTMKTPVMIEVFRQAAEGTVSLEDSVVVSNSFKSIIDGSEYSLSFDDDSEDGLYRRIGQKETVRNLVVKMITVSSNLATNILIGIVGPDNIMKTMTAMGCNDIRVLRGVEDGKAFAAGKNNSTTAYDLMLIFQQIARKNIIRPDACDEMLSILRAQKFNDMIPALLPSDVIVAHKTGSITNVQHDSGILTLPDGHMYVLVILSKELKSNKEGIGAIALLSKAVYDAVTH